MAEIYVATSKALSEWGASVGISKSLFKLGIAEDGAKEAVARLNEDAFAGVTDWKLLKVEDAGGLDEAEALERLGKREPAVDPRYYPRIKGATGIFRVKPKNVENSMLVERAMAGEASLDFKLTPADIAAYLIKNAKG
jgi:hypothetical protein